MQNQTTASAAQGANDAQQNRGQSVEIILRDEKGAEIARVKYGVRQIQKAHQYHTGWKEDGKRAIEAPEAIEWGVYKVQPALRKDGTQMSLIQTAASGDTKRIPAGFEVDLTIRLTDEGVLKRNEERKNASKPEKSASVSFG